MKDNIIWKIWEKDFFNAKNFFYAFEKGNRKKAMELLRKWQKDLEKSFNKYTLKDK